MKKILFKLVLLGLIGAIGGGYYLWQEATQVPEEYTEAVAANNTSTPDLPLQPSQITQQATASKQKIEQPIVQAKPGQKVALKLTDRDLTSITVANLAASQLNKQIPSGVSGVKTTIKDGKIRTGAMVNVDRLVRDSEPGSQTAALSKLTEKLPFLKDRDVYIGIVGKPIVKDGRIKLDNDTQIKIGKVTFTVAQLSQNLGVSEEKIQKAIELKLQQQNLKVDRINLENDRFSIDGEKQ
jgi:hypothetical protein